MLQEKIGPSRGVKYMNSAEQKKFLKDIKYLMKNNVFGLGFCYWGGEWIAFKGITSKSGSSWENQAFWDYDRKALPVLEVYSED